MNFEKISYSDFQHISHVSSTDNEHKEVVEKKIIEFLEILNSPASFINE